MRDRLFCVSCEGEVSQLAFEFETFGEQQGQAYNAHFGVCYECFYDDYDRWNE